MKALRKHSLPRRLAAVALFSTLTACEQQQPTMVSTPAPSEPDANRGAQSIAKPGTAPQVVGAPSRSSAQPEPNTISNADREFLLSAAELSFMRVAASRIALEQAENPDIKRFAGMVITDDMATDNELRDLARSKGVQLPQEEAGEYARDINRLRSSSGASFDQAYAKKVARRAHEDTVSLFTRTVAYTHDAQIKAFAEKALPLLRSHLELAAHLLRS